MRRFTMTCLSTIAATMITVLIGLVLPSTSMADARTSAVTQVTAAWDGRRI